jgi:hypothetical protein
MAKPKSSKNPRTKAKDPYSFPFGANAPKRRGGGGRRGGKPAGGGS